MFSTFTLAQAATSAPTDEAEVRSTVTVVNEDAPAAVAEHAPGYNDVQTDPDTDGGLTERNLASYVQPSEKYIPFQIGDANQQHNEIVNQQVSTSGTAAGREAQGEWGHGTFKVVEGIEPTIVDGREFGPHFFKSTERPDAGSGDYMSPAAPADPATRVGAQAAGVQGARAAVADSQYSAYYNVMMGGN